ncbi:hypothetical protein NS389_22035 [Pantoea dispersa]|nr:hypothetical protein NS389_22035 [Pantoea dispersa]KTS44833.1 hypothetical protein NS380_21855 [Pantoea dispersa]
MHALSALDREEPEVKEETAAMRENPALTVETAQMVIVLMALPAGRDVPAAPILMRTENFISLVPLRSATQASMIR